MLTPNYILRLSEGAEEIASDLHTEIIKQIVDRIMTRLQRGDDYILTARDKWQLDVLQEAGYLLQDIQKEIAKKTKLQQKEIKAAYEDAGVKAVEYDNDVYRAVGIPTTDLKKSPYLVRLLQRNYEATLKEWANYTRTTALSAQQAFIKECDKAFTMVTSGAMSYSEATQNAIDEIATNGVEVVYPSGHKDTIETATQRAVRTGVTQSCGQITMARAAEMGITLALTSAHMGARPTHELWQGQVFWIDWDKVSSVWPISVKGHAKASFEERAKYRELVEATQLGDITGLMGVNCRHSVSPYIDGVSYNPFKQIDSTENNIAYQLSQRQRAMERDIRRTKRKVMALKEALDKADAETAPGLRRAYEKEAAKLQEKNARYDAFCREHKLPRLDERLKIAGWSRSEAAKATAAARVEVAIERLKIDPGWRVVDEQQALEKARDINLVLNTYTTKPSAWSGKIQIGDKEWERRHPRIAGIAEWDHSITLRKGAIVETLIHENLHTRSILLYENEEAKRLYLRFQWREEGAVEYYARQVCSSLGLPINAKAYFEQCDALEHCFLFQKDYTKEIDFARAFFETPIDERYNFLQNLTLKRGADKGMAEYVKIFKGRNR